MATFPNVNDMNVQYPNRYRMKAVDDEGEGEVVDLVPEYGSVVDPGTPLDSSLFDGIKEYVDDTVYIGTGTPPENAVLWIDTTDGGKRVKSLVDGVWVEATAEVMRPLDADTLGEQGSSDFMRYLPDSPVGSPINGFDANTVDRGGPSLIPIYNGVNTPSENTAVLETIPYSPDWVAQYFHEIDADGGELYRREFHSGTTWGEWEQQGASGGGGIVGRNLVLNSKPNATGTYYILGGFLSEPWEVGATYTITIKGTVNEPNRFQLPRGGDDASATYLDDYDAERDVYTATFVYPAPNGEPDPYQFTIYNYPWSTATNASIEWIKIERGTVSTDWTPAPEDCPFPIGYVVTNTGENPSTHWAGTTWVSHAYSEPGPQLPFMMPGDEEYTKGDPLPTTQVRVTDTGGDGVYNTTQSYAPTSVWRRTA